MEEFTLPHNAEKGVVYHRFACSECGKQAENTYSEPYRSQMRDRELCWDCNYWLELDEYLAKHRATTTIIDGHTYKPGNCTNGSMRGMGGRRFDIEYIEGSAYAGQIITTFDLWSGADLPEKLRVKYPDTARFLNGAEKANAGGTMCWDASSNKNPPYKPPSALVRS